MKKKSLKKESLKKVVEKEIVKEEISKKDDKTCICKDKVSDKSEEQNSEIASFLDGIEEDDKK